MKIAAFTKVLQEGEQGPGEEELWHNSLGFFERYLPGKGTNIFQQTGSLENHRLKMAFFGGYVSSLEGNQRWRVGKIPNAYDILSWAGHVFHSPK